MCCVLLWPEQGWKRLIVATKYSELLLVALNSIFILSE